MGEGNAVAGKLTQPGELERLYLLLNDQKDLISAVQNRVQPVSHPVPSEPSTDRSDRPNPHLSHAADIVNEHNSWLRQILAELAI